MKASSITIDDAFFVSSFFYYYLCIIQDDFIVRQERYCSVMKRQNHTLVSRKRKIYLYQYWKMKKTLLWVSLALAATMLAGCKEEKHTHIIITQKPKAEKPKAPQKMGDYEQTMRINWLGATYTLETKLEACDSLPMVDDGSAKYFDNIIRLRVVRADGSTFYSHTFSKKDFNSCLTDAFRRNGALLGIVYVKSDDNYLYFAASVGSPDKSSDEYIPMVLKIHRLGGIEVSKDTQLDTADDAYLQDADADDDGI